MDRDGSVLSGIGITHPSFNVTRRGAQRVKLRRAVYFFAVVTEAGTDVGNSRS
jgi:hypothetical protein